MAKKRLIMVVDDEATTLKLVEGLLRKLGHDVITVSKGSECLKLAAKRRPDLIFLDIMMPGLDGGTTAHKLADNPKTKDIPIVYLTGILSDKEEAMTNRVTAGRPRFIAKPVDKAKLAAVIEDELD